MRTAMKIRRGLRGAVDPITAQYDAILATEPDIPLLYCLIEYRGQIVLFQDAPCTVPVEDIGDPIGGQRHPITGEILAVQTTDAERLIWLGEEIGAQLSESATGTRNMVADLGLTAPFTMAMRFLSTGGSGRRIDGRTSSNNIIWCENDDHAALWDGAWQNSDRPWIRDELHTTAAWIDANGDFRYYDSDLGWGQVFENFGTLQAGETTLYNHTTPGSGGNALRGTIQHALFWDQKTEDVEFQE